MSSRLSLCNTPRPTCHWTAYLGSFFQSKGHLLVWDVFAAIDQSQDDVAQSRQREAQPWASFPIFAKGFHTTAEVDEV